MLFEPDAAILITCLERLNTGSASCYRFFLNDPISYFSQLRALSDHNGNNAWDVNVFSSRFRFQSISTSEQAERKNTSFQYLSHFKVLIDVTHR
jgi:hypothetical protein